MSAGGKGNKWSLKIWTQIDRKTHVPFQFFLLSLWLLFALALFSPYKLAFSLFSFSNCSLFNFALSLEKNGRKDQIDCCFDHHNHSMSKHLIWVYVDPKYLAYNTLEWPAKRLGKYQKLMRWKVKSTHVIVFWGFMIYILNILKCSIGVWNLSKNHCFLILFLVC